MGDLSRSQILDNNKDIKQSMDFQTSFHIAEEKSIAIKSKITLINSLPLLLGNYFMILKAIPTSPSNVLATFITFICNVVTTSSEF